MLIALYSPHSTHDATYLANYAYINLNDPAQALVRRGPDPGRSSAQANMQ